MKRLNIEGLTCYSAEQTVASSPLSNNVKHLLLESDPANDYYSKGNFPPNEKHLNDRHLYIPIKKGIICFQDAVYKKAIQLSKKLGTDLTIYPGQMTMQNNHFQCIRMNTKSSKNLPFIIEEFKKMGIRIFPEKNINAYKSVIFYKKYTNFKNLEEGVYQDENNSNRYFFKIPSPIELDKLKKGIEKIKTNCEYHLFDSFYASLFHQNKISDFIGIYSKHCDESRFGELKQEIQKVF